MTEKTDTYLNIIKSRGSRPGLSRITALMRLLGSPQNKLNIIHVAGTNGKGSICAMLCGILTAAGYSTGMFTSPSIEGICSSFTIDGREIPEQELDDIIAAIMRAERNMNDKPTEFEVLTAAAYKYFYGCNCDIAIIETGMGGKNDATNCADRSVLSIITDIAFDHTSWLGETIPEIAAEKAGIIKDRCPVLFGGSDKAAEKVISDIAGEHNAPFYTADRNAARNIQYTKAVTKFDHKDLRSLELSLAGAYQPGNAAVTLDAIDILRRAGYDIPETAVRKGLSAVKWQGRFEFLANKTGAAPIVYDGAHNPQGMEQAAESIKKYFGADRKIVLLTGVMADKEYKKMAKIISPLCRKVCTVTPNNPRALSAEKLAETFSELGLDAAPFTSINDGVSAAKKEAVRLGLPLVILGTLYFYSDIKNAVDNSRRS